MTIKTTLHRNTQKNLKKIVDGFYGLSAIFKLKDIWPILTRKEREFLFAYAKEEYDYVPEEENNNYFV